MKLSLGISTCPNDTFAFHGILRRAVDLRGLEFDVRLLDVQQLNEQLAAGALDYSKASFYASLHLAGRYGVVRAGSALGMGVGPLLLAARDGAVPGAESRVLCPGAWTTAALLFQCLHPEARRIEHRVFSEIMPALKRDEADFGVVIHEGRFTYRQEGLALVEDLGVSWERLTGGPVPLGGILGRLEIPDEVHVRFCAVLRDSISYAYAHRDEVFATMQRYAQELEPDVIWSHVDLYVNEYTVDLGQTGVDALATLQRMAERAQILPSGTPPVRLLG
jgi:1,4-dihydroxy-6-naphthoate synthase